MYLIGFLHCLLAVFVLQWFQRIVNFAVFIPFFGLQSVTRENQIGALSIVFQVGKTVSENNGAMTLKCSEM